MTREINVPEDRDIMIVHSSSQDGSIIVIYVAIVLIGISQIAHIFFGGCS